MTDVRVTHDSIFGEHLYRVYVDEELYTKFWSKNELTWADQNDVRLAYQEVLTYWPTSDTV